MPFMLVSMPVHGAGRHNRAAFGTMSSVGNILSPSAARNSATLASRCREFRCSASGASRHVSSLRLERQQSIGRGSFFRNITTLQTPRRLGASEFHVTRAGIKKKIKKAVKDFEVSLQNGNIPEVQDGKLSQLAVSLPLGLASFEGLYLFGWVASLRGLLPGSRGFFTAGDLILCSIMFANCVVGWCALDHSRSGIKELPRGKLTRKLKAAGPGFLDMVFSLALSFVPFANLFLWFRFASRQRHLPARAKAAVVANALIYEGPRFFGLLLLISGGVRVFLQIFLVSNVAVVFSALHRPFEEARIKNEKVLMEVSKAKKIGGKKAQKEKPTENLKEISVEERERIDRLRELEEFDMLLAQSSSRSDSSLTAKPKEWSVGETMEWLGQQGLARYATTFAENSIDGELLLQLTNDDLRDELKILSFGDRKKLDLLVQQLKKR